MKIEINENDILTILNIIQNTPTQNLQQAQILMDITRKIKIQLDNKEKLDKEKK